MDDLDLKDLFSSGTHSVYYMSESTFNIINVVYSCCAAFVSKCLLFFFLDHFSESDVLHYSLYLSSIFTGTFLDIRIGSRTSSST